MGNNSSTHQYSSVELSDRNVNNMEYGTRDRNAQQSTQSRMPDYYTTTDTEIKLTPKGDCVCISFTTILILTIIWILASLNYVAYNQYALEKFKFGAVSPTPVLDQGVYVLSPFYDLVYFPETYIKVAFVAPVFSDTGMEFDMEIQAYCKILPENLYDMYNTFSNDYEQRIEYTMKNTIKNKASQFSVNDFLKNRPLIENITSINVYDDIKLTLGIICPDSLFKITNIVFPDNIIQYALQSAIALQKNQIATNQQEVDVYIANTQQQVAEILAQSKLILQQSVYDSTKIIAYAQYDYNNRVNSARGTGIANFLQKLGITSQDDVNNFIDVLALLENANKTIFSGMNGVSMIINNK